MYGPPIEAIESCADASPEAGTIHVVVMESIHLCAANSRPVETALVLKMDVAVAKVEGLLPDAFRSLLRMLGLSARAGG